MPGRSATVVIGQPVPEFELQPANGAEAVSLQSCLRRGPLVMEFLRGTW